MQPRQMYVFDPKVINEQQCRDDALEMLRKGTEDEVRIHKHKASEHCQYEMMVVIDVKQLAHLPERHCYRFTKETK